MDKQILSDADINKIWKNVIPVTSEEAIRSIKEERNIPRPVKVKNGYLALFTDK